MARTRLKPKGGRLGSAFRAAYDRLDRLAFPASQTATEHWQRVVLNRAVDTYITSLHPPERTAVEISGDAHAHRPWKSYVTLTYPEFDLCAELDDPSRYDVVICEQVLEHVEDPCAAAANLRRLCAPGGSVLVSTPFLIKVHELPEYAMRDYWRFTPRGLRTLLERTGLEVEMARGWGNRACVVGNLGRWSAYRSWHSLQNERDIPVQVWAFARNPS